MGRWRRHLDPSIKRDGWQEEEDEQLRELYAEYGECLKRGSEDRVEEGTL